jgi:hypothetical protein
MERKFSARLAELYAARGAEIVLQNAKEGSIYMHPFARGRFARDIAEQQISTQAAIW